MEGRRKELLLLVLAVVALGLALYTFMGKSQTPTATTPATERAVEGREQARAPEGEEAQASAEGEEGVTAPVGGTQRNPFIAPNGPAAAPVEERPEAGPESPVATEGEPAREAEETQTPTLTLTGIVEGRPTVAILRENDQRYFVRVGDIIGNYRVQSINGQQVVLTGQQGRLILRMGGRQ